LKTSSEALWALASLTVGGALCFVPLFDVLGYEWCLAMAVVGALAGAQLGAVVTTRQRRLHAPATVARLYGAVVARTWLLLVPPLLAIVANAARVRNCDLAAGLAWFALLPLVSAAMGAAAGVVAGLSFRWRRALWPSLLAVGAIGCSILYGLVRYYRAPPIFAYDPFVGYFAGALYDEDVRIGRALLWARLYQGTLAATALSACALFLDGATLSVRARAARGRWAPLALTVAVAAFALGLHARRAQLQFELDATDVARALGAEKRTAHFVLHYSPTGPYAKEIDAYAIDFELRWAQHARLFARTPALPVHAFLFDSPAHKRALVGASNTMVTKGWRGETYLHYDGWPQSSLSHELAHIFAATHGDRLLGSSHHGLTFNVGLMEGVAVAAAWPEWEPWQPLTPHQIVKVLRDGKLVDDGALVPVMGPRFYALGVSEAYAIAGSFCRFLIDTRGADKLMAIHRAGGREDAWRRIYGVDFAALGAEWQRFVDGQAVSAADRAFALAWLRRPSVFGRPCAHAVAVERQQAWQAARAGDRAGALATWRAVCDGDLSEPQDLANASDAALLADDRREARRFATDLLARHDPGDVLRGSAEMALGDVALLDGDVAAASLAYERAARLPMDDWSARMLTLKRLVSSWPSGQSRTTLARVLVIAERESEPSFDLTDLRALVDHEPHRALFRYVLARQLLARNRFREVVDLLSVAGAGEPLPDARLDEDRQHLAGAAAFRVGEYARARSIFARLAEEPGAGEAVRRDARDWRDRCEFAATYRR
jgi:hypothetical protein